MYVRVGKQSHSESVLLGNINAIYFYFIFNNAICKTFFFYTSMIMVDIILKRKNVSSISLMIQIHHNVVAIRIGYDVNYVHNRPPEVSNRLREILPNVRYLKFVENYFEHTMNEVVASVVLHWIHNSVY